MSVLQGVAWTAVAAVVGALLTNRVRERAIRTALIDVPNERSSHTRATPRGGGLAIVVVAALALALLAVRRGADAQLAALAIAAIALAALGWGDDRRGLSVSVRLGVQCAVAVAIVLLLGPIERVEIGGLTWALGGAAHVLTVIWIVWLVNLYNFMDGIDGIAAVEAIVAGATMAVWFALVGNESLALFACALAGACLGFLKLNWAPARVFMGDVGSLTVGGLLAALTVVGSARHGIPFGAFLILLAVFVGDASFTLLRRLVRGENVLRAHRSHLYQRAVQAGCSHAQVVVAVLIANIVLVCLASAEAARSQPRALWPLAALAVLGALAGAVVRREARQRAVS